MTLSGLDRLAFTGSPNPFLVPHDRYLSPKEELRKHVASLCSRLLRFRLAFLIIANDALRLLARAKGHEGADAG